MRIFKSRYAYPLVFICLVVSVVLQLAWLSQLYNAQRLQLAEDIETSVAGIAKTTLLRSLIQETYPGDAYRGFFLSKEWLNLRMAFDNAHLNGFKNFNYAIDKDSAVINLSLHLYRPNVKWHTNPVSGLPVNAKLLTDEHFSRMAMQNGVDSVIRNLHLTGLFYFRIYDYRTNQLNESNLPKTNSAIAFISSRYSYNLLHLGKYQLLVPSLNSGVFYRMRLYILSSLMMIILTGATFYFILKLLKSQRLYTAAQIAFTNNVTHELKTPVATIGLALESISKYKLDSDPVRLKEYIELSRHELQRLNLMIDKVLNLEQSGKAELQLIKELFDVQTGLLQVTTSMQLQFRANNANLKFLPSAEPCFVLGDPLHLNNVFYNLLENALKYGGKGVDVVVSCAADKNQVEIDFKDNGPGIPAHYHEKIFDRFFRIQQHENIQQASGTGLGLSYVKQIIEQHKGTITVKSEPGTGSAFTIILPAAYGL